jgi:hypothetical protein
MYEQTTAQRRVALVDRFDAAAAGAHGIVGALIHISQNPFRVPKYWASATGPLTSRAPRARAALARLEALGLSEVQWSKIAKGNRDIPTTLAPIGREDTVRLLWHAYILAVVNLHVILGFPLVDLPMRETFDALLAA